MSDLDHAFLTVYSADGIGMNVMSVAVKRLSKYVQIIIQFFRAEVLRGLRQYGFYFRRGQCLTMPIPSKPLTILLKKFLRFMYNLL